MSIRISYAQGNRSAETTLSKGTTSRVVVPDADVKTWKRELGAMDRVAMVEARSGERSVENIRVGPLAGVSRDGVFRYR